MAVDLMGIALEFLADYGLIAVFVLLVLDGAMLMPVLPGEAVMIMAVTQYAQELSDLGVLIAIATAAAVVGSLILYGIARIGGRPLIESHPRLFMMDKQRRESLEETFEKPLGQSLVMFLRVIPFTRIVINIPAGLAKMGLGRFIVLSSVGMLIFHAGFMWLAFEYQQPGSAVAEQATALQEAYATPAWQFLQTHEIVGILGAIAVGSYFSFKSSRRMLKYPEGAVTSILGWLSVRVLIFGAAAGGMLLYIEPQLIYDVALAGGLDIPQAAQRLEVDPVRGLGYTLGVFGLLGIFLRLLEGRARRARDRAEAAKELEARRADESSDGAIDFEETSS